MFYQAHLRITPCRIDQCEVRSVPDRVASGEPRHITTDYDTGLTRRTANRYWPWLALRSLVAQRRFKTRTPPRIN